jgi:hypothetical protein
MASKRSGELEDRQARDLVAMVERVASDPRLAARFVAAVLAAHASANPDAPERAPAPHVPMGRTIPLTPEEWAAIDPPVRETPYVDPRVAADVRAELEAIKVGAPSVSFGNEKYPIHLERVGVDTFHVNGPHPFTFAQVFDAIVALRSGTE